MQSCRVHPAETAKIIFMFNELVRNPNAPKERVDKRVL